MADLRLFVVAGDPLARTGLVAILSGQPGCEVVGGAPSGETLSDELEIHRPDVIIWDLGWEPEEGLVPLAELAEDSAGLEPGIVALLPDQDGAAAAWSAGARGLLLRDAGGERLLAAAEAVALGLTTIEPTFLERLMPVASLAESGPAEELTPRELEVLDLLAEGLANRAIAQRLAISEHTVKFHVNALMGKLGAQSRTEAVVRATRLGIIRL